MLGGIPCPLLRARGLQRACSVAAARLLRQSSKHVRSAALLAVRTPPTRRMQVRLHGVLGTLVWSCQVARYRCRDAIVLNVNAQGGAVPTCHQWPDMRAGVQGGGVL